MTPLTLFNEYYFEYSLEDLRLRLFYLMNIILNIHLRTYDSAYLLNNILYFIKE